MEQASLPRLPELPDDAPSGVTFPRVRPALVVSVAAHILVIGGLIWLDREPVTRIEQHITQIALVHDQRSATADTPPATSTPVAMPAVTVTSTSDAATASTAAASPPPISAPATTSPDPQPVLAVAAPIAGFDTALIDTARRVYVAALGRVLQQKAARAAESIDERLEGRVVVVFTVDRGGNVTAVQVSESSGIAVLDAAAKDVVARSSPLPAPPAGLPIQTMEIELPVIFSHR